MHNNNLHNKRVIWTPCSTATKQHQNSPFLALCEGIHLWYICNCQSVCDIMCCMYVLLCSHYNDIIMDTMASQITSLTIVYSTVYLDADQRKHQSSTSLAFVRGIHWGLVNSPHKWPVTRKMFPFDDIIVLFIVDFPIRRPNCNFITVSQSQSLSVCTTYWFWPARQTYRYRSNTWVIEGKMIGNIFTEKEMSFCQKLC